ncbi:MAG: Tim44 domain-containing protein, partial [Rhizobiaceae bacterium]|nr:Tim44 domain-containing protein [Rhizobiaceae bacterium]
TFDDADARRAGSSGFGSRGMRTYQAPAITRTAPDEAAPIQRSMTPQTSTPQTAAPQPLGAQRPSPFGGFGRSMIGGLIAGGLLGMFLGTGFGGGFGFLGMLLQIVVLVAIAGFFLRRFANRQQAPYPAQGARGFQDRPTARGPAFSVPAMNSGATRNPTPNAPQSNDEIGLTQNDLNRFEQLLTEVQTAYGAEDYATLRRLSTPEAMSYLAEELGENATRGVRNSVSDVKLLQGDISESWRENDRDYATLAMRYSSIDAMLDRNTGRVVEGDARNPSQAVEHWTFVRNGGSDWKLSAIQGQ